MAEEGATTYKKDFSEVLFGNDFCIFRHNNMGRYRIFNNQ